MLLKIITAPTITKQFFLFQNLSTKKPKGIFKAQGIPAQKPIEAIKEADKFKYSLRKKIPTIFVRPDTPADKYIRRGGMYNHLKNIIYFTICCTYLCI